MTISYLGLGSNLDGPEKHLKTALDDIGHIDQTHILACSSFYKSPPLGPQDQPDFINCVAKLETGLSAHMLLSALQEIEDQHGRKRERLWGPRTLDLDILLFGERVINDEDLTVPHPQMRNRGFVLVPLTEIDPDISIPGLGKASNLISSLDINSIIRI